MAAHEQGGGRSYDRFYPISIAIIGECGRGRPADQGETVLVVISKRVVAAFTDAPGQIAGVALLSIALGIDTSATCCHEKFYIEELVK